MEFIRQNIGVFAAGVVCVVLAGLLALVNVKQSATIDAALKVREDASGTLLRLSRPIPHNGKSVYVNETLLEWEKARVSATEQALVDVAYEATEWNKRNFKVLQATIAQGTFAAFPVNQEILNRHENAFRDSLSQAYLNAVAGVLTDERLGATMPPSQEDMAEEVDAELARLRYTPQYREAERAGEDLRGIARKNVLDKRSALAAQGKRIYADPNMLPRAFTGVSEMTFDQLWRGQVSLWVMSDVLGAISDLNQEVTQGIPDKAVTVSDSAVRMLEIITVSPNYVGGRQGTAGSTLTQRISCQQYDVIHYSFSVVMPARYVPDLERTLMARNYHTVLNASMALYDNRPENGYQLGHEPLMQVAFDCEILLLTSWERGTKGRIENENGEMVDGWVYPPLMPTSFLKTLDNTARREVDMRRLESNAP